MVTGASTADVAVVLLDARKGVIEQTQRHTYIAAMLGIPHVVFAVNKMDLVDFDEARFREIERELGELTRRVCDLRDAATIPIAALPGDNVVEPSERMPWWDGGTFLERLETIEHRGRPGRRRTADFPVQWVIRPMSDEHHDYRGYAGQVAGGEWRAGDEVVVLPSGLRTTVAAVETHDGPLDVAVQGQSVVVRLADEVDASRGDMLCGPADQPVAARALEATVCWMSERPVQTGARLAVKHTTRWTRAILDEIVSVLDVETLEQRPADGLALNDLARVRLRLAGPLLVDPYAENRATGAFVLVDEATNETVGAGMVADAPPPDGHPARESPPATARRAVARTYVLYWGMRVEYREEPCRSALNRVKGMPFDWSLNPYTGCAHRCTFCYVRAFEARADRPSDDRTAARSGSRSTSPRCSGASSRGRRGSARASRSGPRPTRTSRPRAATG